VAKGWLLAVTVWSSLLFLLASVTLLVLTVVYGYQGADNTVLLPLALGVMATISLTACCTAIACRETKGPLPFYRYARLYYDCATDEPSGAQSPRP
jgi:hypothetical protein